MDFVSQISQSVSAIVFFATGALAVVAAFNVILQRNPIYSAVGLITLLIALAGVFLTLASPFIAAIQVIVYAGAIMVLFVFVIMLLNVSAEEAITDKAKYLKLIAPRFVHRFVGGSRSHCRRLERDGETRPKRAQRRRSRQGVRYGRKHRASDVHEISVAV